MAANSAIEPWEHPQVQVQQAGARQDIDEAVEIGRTSVTLAQGSERGGVLGNLAVALRARHEAFGDHADLIAAVDASREAVAVTGSGDPHRAAVLDILGATLRARYAELGSPGDLDEAIGVFRQAAEAAPAGHPRRSQVTRNLGGALEIRFTRAGDVRDLDDAIAALRETVAASAGTEQSRAQANLGVVLQGRFSRLGDPADLEEAIMAGRQAITILAQDSPALSALGSAYLARYQRFGRDEDLREALGLQQRAVDTSSPEHSDHAMYLSNLGNTLREKHTRFSDPADLEAAVHAMRQALDAAPAGDDARTGRLAKLSNMLYDRHRELGRPDDLDAAVDALREVSAQTSPDHPDYANRLRGLSRALRSRFETVGDLADLSEAIDLARSAVDKMTGSAQSAYSLIDLGVALQIRFERLHQGADLDDAIAATRRAVDITPADHRDLASFLDRFGVVMQLRFKETGSVADIDAAVEAGQRARSATRADDPQRTSNLALAHYNRFLKLADLTDLDAAMALGGEAVTATPYDHSARAKYVGNLANYSYERFRHTQETEFLSEALSYYQLAARLPTAPAFVRASNAHSWGSLAAQIGDWPAATDAFGLALEHLAALTGRRLTRASRQYYLEEFTAVGSHAAAASLNLDAPDPSRALSLLEQGRGILLAQALETRSTEALALSRDSPVLAGRLTDLARQLEGDADPGLSVTAREASGTSDPERRRRLSAEWDQLIDDIRHRPGFDEFMKPPNAERLRDIVREGPVAAINVSDLRCDALILSQHGVQAVPLPELTLGGVTEHAEKLLKAVEENSGDTNEKLFSVLEWLWDTVAGPVLDHLGFSGPPRGADWPRLWWMPTGPLSLLPIHAAGHHLESGSRRRAVLDRVVSSYTPTLRTLQHSQARPRSGEPRFLGVAMTRTPGESALASAEVEIDKAIYSLKVAATRLTNLNATRGAVLDTLPGATWAHFACHATSDPAEPGDSSLLLNDGPLSVRDLTSLDISRANLAYLSACRVVGQFEFPTYSDFGRYSGAT